jgi:hypothetical protein
MKPVTREVLVERRQNTLRWSSIIGGVLVAIGAWMVLQMIGLGAGLTAIDLDDASQSRGAGIGAGIWTVIVPLIALFVGGYVTARLARLLDREHAALHGAVLWAITTLLGVMTLTWTIGTVLGGVVRTGGVVVSSAGSMVSGIDPAALAGPENTQQMNAVLRDVGARAARGETVDHDAIVAAITRHTDLSRPQADDLAVRIESQLDLARSRAGDLRESAKEAAQTATDTAGKTLLGAGIALLLGLATSILGAVLGARRRRPDDTTRVVSRTPTEQGVPIVGE